MINFDVSDLLAGLDRYEEDSKIKIVRGAKDVCRLATDDMRATDAHGDITGATRASYVAFPVGLGADGHEALDSLDAVGALNPGHSAHDHESISEKFAVIFMSGTDYQYKLETENGGKKAVLTPTFLAYYLAVMEAIANEMR